MKKTFIEKLMSQCRGITKKYKWLKKPVTVYMTVVLFFYYSGVYVASNSKRFSCVALLLLFSVIGSSFAYPESLEHQTMTMNDTQNEVMLVAEQELNTEEVASIEADKVENYDDITLVTEEELDTYTLEEILDDNSDLVDMVQIPVQNTALLDFESYQFDTDDWKLILINKQHSIPENYEFRLGTIKGSMQCDERILEDLLAMMQAAKEDGVDLVICSPYRDYNRQTNLFEKKITRYMNAGMSYMDAYKTASVTVTSPNASEHRIGLAIDFYSSTYTSLDTGFAETQAGKWLNENSHDYGFVLRYPEGKEFITGIEYEPWHFRYVGVEAATFITQKGITLEEFWEDL